MFESIVEGEQFDLAAAFLAFAMAEYPHLDAAHYLRLIDDLAVSAPPDLDMLGSYLHSRGFTGNTDEYADPRNSFLNEVLERGLGIPISLSVVWIEVGRRAGLDIQPIGLPMHFLVAVGDRYADPFNAGRTMDADEVVALFGRLTQGRVPWNDEYLRPSQPREVVRRALNNLKGIYGTSGLLKKALWVENYLLAIPGTDVQELRERATVLAGLGRNSDAIADLATYMELVPAQAEEVEEQIRKLSAALN